MLSTTWKYIGHFLYKTKNNNSLSPNSDDSDDADNRCVNSNNHNWSDINSDSDSLCDSRNYSCDTEMVQFNISEEVGDEGEEADEENSDDSCGGGDEVKRTTRKELENIFTSNCKIDSYFNGSCMYRPHHQPESNHQEERPEDDEMREVTTGECWLDNVAVDDNRNGDIDESDMVIIDPGDVNLVPTDNNKIVSTGFSAQKNRMRVALGVLFRLILPFVNGVVNSTRKLRNARAVTVVRNLRSSRTILTNMLAYAANTISLSLSSVQVVHRIPPILRSLKFRKQKNMLTQGSAGTDPSSPSFNARPLLESQSSIESLGEPEKCVTCTVLAEPPPGTPIRADVILIHGLHGSLKNTWKQGVWNSEGRRVKFERPPKPEIRPPKRPRHSRSNHLRPPVHHTKRPRIEETDLYFNDAEKFCGLNLRKFFNENDEFVSSNSNKRKRVSFYCDEPDPDSTEFVDEVEFSFPRFRYRIESDEDGGAELSDDVEINNNREGRNESNDGDKNKSNGQRTEDKEKWSPCWPGDWLPLDCPGVRVIALNYTTDPYLWRPLWVKKRNRSSLEERSREMTRLLVEHGVGVGHPIVWVGHSKGGIFIKQIIVDAYESGRASSASIWRSSRGVLFYSVPHRGSPLADFNLPLLRQSIELHEIQKNCPSILELHRRFVALYRSGQLQVQVFSFVETALTLMSVLYLRIVGVDSADPGIGEVCGVHLDHREICKPRSRNCMLYTELTKMINKVS